MYRTPEEAFKSLPEEAQTWVRNGLILWMLDHGLRPDLEFFWRSLSESDQWKFIGYVIRQYQQVCRAKPVKASPILHAGTANSVKGMGVSSTSATENRLEYFDLVRLTQEQHWDLYPHVAWLCPSGWGKDFNCSGLMAQADGEVVACLIKDAQIWRQRCPKAKVICNGYDVSAIESCLQELCDRLESRVQNIEPRTPLTIVLSDYPSIVEGIEDITENYIARPLRDARSQRIRYHFFLQESNVAALKLEGRSDLLRNVRIIRGGEFAIEHATALVKAKLLPVHALQELNSSDRPAMFGNQLVRI